jgi:RNA polymerase sigma-70 factor (ECF subfamily)
VEESPAIAASPLPMHDQQQIAEFVQLLTSSQRRLYLHILTFLPNPVDAEEVLQEANVVLWSKADDFQPGTNFIAWARSVAYFEVLAFRKRGTRDRLSFTTELMETLAEESLANEAGQEQRRVALSKCLEKLADRDRSLITNRYVAGGNVQAMADELRRPVSSIYRSLERIRLALLQCIQRTVAGEERSQ